MPGLKTKISVKSTAELKVPVKIVDQVIGQQKAVAIIRKAAKQKRNVLLIGTPGTGKSMLAQAMSELMQAADLKDVLVYPNDDDPNVPKVRVVKAGEGRKIMEQERIKATPSNNFNLIVILFLFLSSFFLLSFGRQEWGDVITAALLIGLFIVSGIMAIGMQLGRSRLFGESVGPKMLVDNSEKKTSPFIDATGARAGALLGDVKHDPLQSFFSNSIVFKKVDENLIPLKIQDLVEELLVKYPNAIERNNENYEGLVIPEHEKIYVMGFKDGLMQPVRVFCVNRRAYNGIMNAIGNENSRVIVTPEHKVFVNGNYVEAEKLTGIENLVTYSQPIITGEDIIKTFSEQDQKDAANYSKFAKIKSENPAFGYKKIAKLLGVNAGQTRWWNNNKFKPKAVNTVERLEFLGLLPFALDNSAMPIVARVLGTTFGDGGIQSNLNQIFLSSSEESSLQEYETDLVSIFGEDIRKNFSRITSGINNSGKLVRNTNRDAVRFFIALGAPRGRKNKDVKIPAWIHLNKAVEKEFFGALFGNELCSPKFSEKTRHINDFAIAFGGAYELKTSKLALLESIAAFLNSYGIKSSRAIYEHNFRGKSWMWRLSISTEIENLLRFHHFIPIRYSKNKAQRIGEAIENVLGRKVDSCIKFASARKSENYILQTLRVSKNMLQKILLDRPFEFSDKTINFSGALYNITTESGNLFANGILVSNSGGLGTPAHLRVDAGFVHKASGGVLFIDEVSSLSSRAQQELLTAMQEKRYSITGQSELSSGAQVRSEPVPCDFVLVAAGNYRDMQKMHPALRSRIRGYGYEVYMEEQIEDSAENEEKLMRFIAQEITKDGRIPHFDVSAVEEIVYEARKRSGRKNKLTLKLRDLGGLIRAAGDVANEEGAKLVNAKHVIQAKQFARTLEQQISQQAIDMRKEYRVFTTSGAQVGKVNGLAVMGESGVVLPIVAEVAPASSKEEGRTIATGKLGDIAKEAVANVSAIIKRHTGKDTSSYDIHIQFLQTYEGVEGDSASVSVATAVISALEEVAVKQDLALTGSLSVRGEVLPVGGVTQKVEAALEAGLKRAVVPYANKDDVVLNEAQLKRIEIIPVKSIYDVLYHALKDGKKKDKLLSQIKKEIA